MAGLFGSPKVSNQIPAVGALTVQQSSYGTPIAICYGTNRLNGNLVWYDDFHAVQVSTGGGGGGKGGGGGEGGKEWHYYCSFAVGLCEGQISTIGRVWNNKEITTVSALGGTIFTGANGQAAWGYLSTYHPDKAINYSKLAYVGFPDFSLGTSSSTPNLSMEIFATPDATTPSGQDAWPSTIMSSFLDSAAWPTAYLDTLSGSDFDLYTKAMGFAISPFFVEQDTAANQINSLMLTLNCVPVWTDGVLKIIPYGDTSVEGNGAVYTPDLTPQYDLTDDDFIIDGDEDPVVIERTNLSDCYNQQPIEFRNINNNYNIETYTAEDLGHIDMYGVRTASTVKAHHVTDPDTAQMMANLILWRQLYITPIKYTFKLSWKYCRLEPMDYVTLTQSLLGLYRFLVRITDIEEDENGMLSVSAEPAPGSISEPAIYHNQNTVRFYPDYKTAPGSVNSPVFFEPPLDLLQTTRIELWLAISSSSENWGGCYIHISTDGLTYSFLDEWKIPARQGVLTDTLPSVTASPDTTNILSVDLSQSLGTINAAPTEEDATNLNTLCLVDSELLAFGDSTLTSAYNYDLTYLVRGAYGSGIVSHSLGANFVRLDNAIFKYIIDQFRIGKPLYFKFQSFNIYGSALEDLSTLPAYQYTLTGNALKEALDNPTNLVVSYKDDIARLNWTGISDIRSPIWYEVRKGSQFVPAQIVATTKETNIDVSGADTYWVTALYYTPMGDSVYSSVPVSVSVTTPSISKNIIQTYEESTSWTGTCSGDASVSSGSVIISGIGSGAYTPDSGHQISLASVKSAKVIISWTVDAVSLTSDITSVTDITALADVTGVIDSGLVHATPQIRLSTDGGSSWGSWQNWVPGSYEFDKIDWRINLDVISDEALLLLSQFSITVDVESVTQTGTDTSSASGTKTITFATPFNSLPEVTIVNDGAVAGDLLVKGTVTTTGFSYGIQNGGSYVARAVTWSATKY